MVYFCISDQTRTFCNMTQHPLSEARGWDQHLFSDTILEVAKNMTVPVTVLHITSMTALRSDAHVGNWSDSPYTPDCSHWCLPGVPDVWNEIVLAYLLTDYRIHFWLMGEYSKLRLLSEFLPIIAHVHPSIIDVNCFILGTFARRKTQSTLYVPSSCCFNSFNGPYLHALVFVALSKNHLKQYFSYVSSLCLGTGVGSSRNRRGMSDIRFFVFIFYF